MTLTLLLQLTSEEQLYAQDVGPVLQPQVEEQSTPGPATDPEENCAPWKEVGTTDCWPQWPGDIGRRHFGSPDAPCCVGAFLFL